MSTPSTKRITQNTTTRKNSGLSDRKDSYTTDGTFSGSLMTMFLSVKNFCTRTQTSAMRTAVNSPFEPRLSIEKAMSSGLAPSLSWIIRKTTVAIVALTMASCFNCFPRS